MRYAEYLQSDLWKRQSLERRGEIKKCSLCGMNTSRLCLHHNTYRNLGDEQYFDLVVLCSNCHFWFHQHFKYDNKKHYFYRTK